MDDNYIDLNYQNSSELLKNNNLLNCYIENNSNLNNNNDLNNNDLIEGFGNFGRVNLEKCCPLEYMWSETQKKCIKVCDGCAIGAYGDINYETLHNHGDEQMSFALCRGDATGAYDFDKINKRYGSNEIVTQHDLNFHIDEDENASGVQPSDEDPWSPVMGGMYQVGSTKQQTSIRNMGTYAADAQEAYLQNLGLDTEYLENRKRFCVNTLEFPIDNADGLPSLCSNSEPIESIWSDLCSNESAEQWLTVLEGHCSNLPTLCEGDELIKNKVCPNNT